MAKTFDIFSFNIASSFWSVLQQFLFLNSGTIFYNISFRRYKDDDDKQKDRISAKNSLESYCFNMQSTIEDENIKSKLGEAERKTIQDKCKETISWLDANQTAETDEYKDKLKEVEGVCSPIITKMYQQSGGAPGGMPGGHGMPGGPHAAHSTGASGPTVEEVD